MKPTVLYPKRSKELLLLFDSLIFIVAGIWMIKNGKIFGWASVIFFAFCGISLVVKMLPSFSFLRLDKNGFTEAIRFRTVTILWKDIDRFAVCYGTVIYFLSKKSREIRLCETGGDGGLSSNYGLRAEKLVELLQEWKSKSQN